ncbi:MAG: hypothetical protein WKG00_28455 [Polyangiaceae bacterium]
MLRHPLSRRARSALPLLLAGAGVLGATAAGCLTRPIEPINPKTTGTGIELLPQSAVEKIDLLLAIDNSRSMSDKQRILATAVPDLVQRLVTPICVDDQQARIDPQPPAGSACPAGSAPEFQAITDIHIGIINSALGSPGGPACADPDLPILPQDSGAHLLTATAAGGAAPTWAGKGFLAWDPDGEKSPPGEDNVGDLTATLRDMVEGVGQTGCGYEAQLESVYRFLVDPEPYLSIEIDEEGRGQPQGFDDELVQQRKDFLRPDSLVAVIMLSDENDCSANVTGIGWRTYQADTLWRPRSECAVDVDDPCCFSCAIPDIGSCPVDNSCFDAQGNVLGADDDNSNPEKNLRCFDQKRRFGFDLLYSTQRYVDGLSQPKVPNRQGQMVPNPLYSDLDTTDGTAPQRASNLVFFAGIVGVPWQDIARDPTNLANGGFKDSSDMAAGGVDGAPTGWDMILGSADGKTLPLDPLMRESVKPRTGSNPATGDALAPPGAALDANSVNGHEWNVVQNDDLQYACVFDLDTPRDCTQKDANGVALHPGCDCRPTADGTPDEIGNPLCQDADGAFGTTQYRAKAYPGVRQLQVLRGLGDQGIVASVCPSFITAAPTPADLQRADYGYRPAVASIIDRLKQAIQGGCQPRILKQDSAGHVQCLVLQASVNEQCSCDAAGTEPVPGDLQDAVTLANELSPDTGWNCFCHVKQLSGDALEACRTDVSETPIVDGKSVDGWCYVDPDQGGNEALVQSCPVTEQRKVRLIGEAKGGSGTTNLIACTTSSE